MRVHGVIVITEKMPSASLRIGLPGDSLTGLSLPMGMKPGGKEA